MKSQSWRAAAILFVLGVFSVNGLCDVIVDDEDEMTAASGTWQNVVSSQAYGGMSLAGRDGAKFTWFLDPQPAGIYEVYIRWSGAGPFAKGAMVDVNAFDGKHEFVMDQSVGRGKRNLLGKWYFGTEGSVTMTAGGSDGSTYADAVWFRLIEVDSGPEAKIISISPCKAMEGESICFKGSGKEKLGKIVAHRWSSNIDGILSNESTFSTSDLAAGKHTISYSVKNDANNWSEPVTSKVEIEAVLDENETIIDNRDTANVASTGTWGISGASGAYGTDSLWARNGATFTWYFTPTTTGTHEVFMWWTEYASRTTNAAVDITNASGTSRVYINQQVNGGMWNSLGKFSFNANVQYRVRITASNGSTVSTCADAVRVLYTGGTQPPEPPGPVAGTENIYVGQIYSWNGGFLTAVQGKLQSMGARNEGSYWTYRNSSQNKMYYIRFATTKDQMIAALKEKGSHIVVGGHSNFGLGPTFATSSEFGGQKIYNMYYANDDRLLQTGSDFVSVNIDGLMYGQAYPNWKAINKDGSSALAPYTYSEGTPPYNYYISYRVPGDPTWYRLELANGSYVSRFSDSGRSAWFSSSGAKPDPSMNGQYFITNNSTYYSRCATTGSWSWGTSAGSYGEDGYMGYCFYYKSRGSGAAKVTWILGVNTSGRYRVSASWYDATGNASNAKYTINHAGGTTVVTANQRRTGSDFWNDLGTFDFNRGENTISLSDAADGRLIADAIWLRPAQSGLDPVYCDNAFRYKFHYITNSTRPNGKVIVKLVDRINPSELGFARMYWGTCEVHKYFLETFGRGIVFFTTGNINTYAGTKYLESYLRGYTDSRILTEVNKIEAVHEYYNFNLKPPSMR